ncbi:hypothetical protein HK102_006859 [Quaeritorhiza haematococci]|nr:hypothetical protein HK102_006859 [Quaeritorhiza haematococci]
MTRVRRKRMHHNIRDIKRSSRTRARTKDLDQIHDDLKAPEKYVNQEENPDLPGMGKHYCLQCARYFISNESLMEHYKGKVHKRRVKQLKEGPYTQAEAEAAVGLTTDNGNSQRMKMEMMT